MKKLILLSLTIFLFNLPVSAQSIEWQTDFKKALAMSRETGKPLLLDFTAVWCKPCKLMDEQFWVRADVIETVKSFVAVKIDFDKETSLAGRYIVRGIPYIAFVDPIGNLITARRGYSTKSVDEINQIFNEMPKDFSPLKKAYDAIEIKKTDGEPLLQIAEFYHKSGMLRLSNDYYKRANKTYVINSNAETRERITAVIGNNFFRIGDYKAANEALEEYLKYFPAGRYEEASISALTIGQARLGNLKDAEKNLELLKTKFPDSKSTASAVKAVEQAKNKSAK